jgi:ATP-binding protein involved in chromosome partitioning
MDAETQKAIDEEKEKIEERLSGIKYKIAVYSGKGGVGKTTVSVNLACGLQSRGYKTGILDADVTGPNVSKMLGLEGELLSENKSIIPFIKNGVEAVSIANLLRDGQAVVWRGPMRSKLIKQFLGDVKWGELDFLIADLPPGTGDEILTITQSMKPDLALIVTTPQEVSLIDADRAIDMAVKSQIPNIALVENMSGFLCPKCGEKISLFGEGGGKKLAEKRNVKYLGSLPLNIETRVLADNGTPIVIEKPQSDISISFYEVINNVEQIMLFRN